MLALEMAAPVLLTGHLLFSCFPFVPVQELLTVFGLSDCIWIIYFYPPAPLQGPL